MVALTYGVARGAAPAAGEATASQTTKGFFARILDAIAVTQMKRAEREIVRHFHLLPLDHELRNGKLMPCTQEELPFAGR